MRVVVVVVGNGKWEIEMDYLSLYLYCYFCCFCCCKNMYTI
jgi:hypothetical protein